MTFLLRIGNIAQHSPACVCVPFSCDSHSHDLAAVTHINPTAMSVLNPGLEWLPGTSASGGQPVPVLWQGCLWTNCPTPRCYAWLALICAEGVNGTWWCVFNRASGKPSDIPQYVTLHWQRELCQCWPLFPPHPWDQNGNENFEIKSKGGGTTSVELLQQ
jgi:hypothetical protein